MDFNATIDLIIRDLEEAREIIDDLKKYPGVPVLQVELAKSKCKTAGEVIALLKTIKNNVPPEVTITAVTVEPPMKEASVKEVEEIPEPEAESPAPQIKKETPDLQVKKPAESTIFADTFIQSSGSLNEQLGSRKTDGDISDHMKTKPISSLTEAIGINDRFFFIREVFNNNKESYSQAITRLDNTGSLNDARAIIMSYTGDNVENEAVRQLLDLVKRKLPANE